jgi:hypothetical protein
MTNNFKRITLALGLTCALLVGTVAVAMPPGPQGHMAGDLFSHMEALKKDLNLTDSQQALWDIAQTKSKATMEQMGSAHGGQMDKLRDALATGNADLRALARDQDAKHEAMHAAHMAARDAWLNLYDKLDAAQKAKVNAAIKKKLDRFAGMQERMKEHMHRAPPSGE